MDTIFTALRVVVSLAAVLGLIWYLRKRISRNGTRSRRKAAVVTVLGKQGVGAKASVVVVDAEGQRFVLGVTEHSVNVLHMTEAPAAPDIDFDDAMAELVADADDSDTTHLPVAPVGSAFGSGSIFAASTWKRTAAVLRQATK